MSNILQNIFKDHYEEMLYTLHPRKSVIENVDKMINCGDPSFGGAMYGCSSCGTFKFVPFRCHSRFCPTCGNKYSIDRTTSMSFKIINVQHRHCVFTIDSELRHFFLEDRKLLSLLFEAVQSVIMRLFHKDNKAEKFTPGFILVLHTFGRDLKWNPHIHCLISEGGIGNSGLWRAKTHFNYKFLRNAFRTALLNLMEKNLVHPSKVLRPNATVSTKKVFMFMQNLTNVIRKLSSNTLDAILADQLSLLHALIITMVKMSLSTTIDMKMTSSSSKQFL